MNIKTVLMLTVIAALTGAVTACFSSKKAGAPASAESCDGLQGTPKSECEARKAGAR